MPKTALHIDDEESRASHRAAVRLIAEVAGYFAKDKKSINELIFVPLTIMSRIVRTHEAIGLLLKEKYLSEAAVLILTQFELRFDLLFVASDINRATQWVGHDNPKTLSVNMKAKLNSLLKPSDADRLYETFGYLSGIKHGNPVYSELAFPSRDRGGHYVISTGSIDDRFSQVFCEALSAYSTFQLVWGAQVINKLVAQYALVDIECRKDVHNQYIARRHIEAAFCRFLKRKVSVRKTFFGIKARMGRTKS